MTLFDVVVPALALLAAAAGLIWARRAGRMLDEQEGGD